MTTQTFANDMVRLGRDLGYVEGLKRAIEIMRKHGLPVDHPARIEVYEELMTGRPPAPAPAIQEPA